VCCFAETATSYSTLSFDGAAASSAGLSSVFFLLSPFLG